MRLLHTALIASVATIAVTATPARATNCVLDTNQDGTATAGTDTVGGAQSGGSAGVPNVSRLACGTSANANGSSGTAIGASSTATGGNATAAGAIAVASAEGTSATWKLNHE